MKLMPVVTLRTTTFRILPLSVLHPHPEQPNFVRLLKGIPALMQAIRQHRLVSPPWVVPVPNRKGHYYVVNGNRRVEASRRLGITSLKVEILPSDVDIMSIFAPAQIAERFSGKDYLTSWALAARISAARGRANHARITNPVIANQIETFVRLVGMSTAIRYGLTGTVAPNVVTRVSDVCDAMVARGQQALASNPRFLKQLTCWLLDTKSYKNVGDAMVHWDHEGFGHLFEEVLDACREGRKYVSVLYPTIHKSQSRTRLPQVRYQTVLTPRGLSLSRARR